jgi:hypothetical protein
VVAGAGGGAGGVAAEGAWHSEQTTGDVLDLLILENGSVYALSATTATAPPILAFDQGPYTVTADQFTAQLTHYNDFGSTVMGAATGTVVQNLSITGTATTNGNPTTQSFRVQPTTQFDSGYNYSSPASLSTIAGAWPAGYLLNQSSPVSFSIDAQTGVLTGSHLANVFDVTIQFGPAPCAEPGRSAAGVAISYVAKNGRRQLSAALQDATRAFGTMLYAQR